MKKFSIFNFQFSKIDAGFTFIEMLVVIVVLSFVGVLIGGIIFSSLRGANKTNVLTAVRQNGSYASAQISRSLINAKSFKGVSAGSSIINDCSLSPGSTYPYIQITTFDDRKLTYACCANSSPPPNFLTISSSSASLSSTDGESLGSACSSGNSLLDTNSVSLQSCSFTCTQTNPSDYPIIGINFSLKQAESTNLSERTSSSSAIPFNTSVTLRNVGR